MTLILKGELTDLVITSQDGGHVSCHKVIVAQLSPLLSTLLAPPETTTLVLADFGKSELHGFMNLIYTGRYDGVSTILQSPFVLFRSSFKTPRLLQKIVALLAALQIRLDLAVDSTTSSSPEK